MWATRQCAVQTSLANTNVQQRPSVCSMSPGVSYSRSCRALARSFPAFAERMRMYPFAHQPERMNGIRLNMKKTILIVAGLLLSVGMMASAAPVSQDGPPPPASPPPKVVQPPQPPPPQPPPPKHRHHHHRQSPPPSPPPPPSPQH
jgi:outer membrane biosynthesis protein TonB